MQLHFSSEGAGNVKAYLMNSTCVQLHHATLKQAQSNLCCLVLCVCVESGDVCVCVCVCVIRFIWITGWSIWTETRLVREPDRNETSATLGELLKQKAEDGVNVSRAGEQATVCCCCC
jgi:hypothetical protein